jgi:SsrA-binding protein
MQFMAVHAHNKKASFDYELLEKFEAGLELRGYEVKAIKAGKMNLVGTRVLVRGGEAYLVGTDIQPYQPGNLPPDYAPGRTLRLLLGAQEISRLAGSEKQQGLTIIPVSVYSKGRHLKLELAVARGKKKFDKREALKKRDVKRQIDRTLKSSD